MSMIGYLYRLDETDLTSILDDSSHLEEFLHPAIEERSPDLLDLDKAWEAIIFILTGSGLADIEEASPPLAWAIISRQEVDADQDLGNGPAHYISAEQVQQIHDALSKKTTAQWMENYDGEEMTELGIYPEIYDEPETFNYVEEHLDNLKAFYADAAELSQAIISFIG